MAKIVITVPSPAQREITQWFLIAMTNRWILLFELGDSMEIQGLDSEVRGPADEEQGALVRSANIVILI
jgi:hypothetical protein